MLQDVKKTNTITAEPSIKSFCHVGFAIGSLLQMHNRSVTFSCQL